MKFHQIADSAIAATRSALSPNRAHLAKNEPGSAVFFGESLYQSLPA
jgi:hypothetical protein